MFLLIPDSLTLIANMFASNAQAMAWKELAALSQPTILQ